nr:hypothetical protein [Bradyrhizobium elkanii]
MRWYDPSDENPPWIKALAEVRHLATREGWRYQHVQAIIVAIDQYAEAALGNREFFLNRPYSIGDHRAGKIP